jgi:hypothetical protein
VGDASRFEKSADRVAVDACEVSGLLLVAARLIERTDKISPFELQKGLGITFHR